MSQVTPPRLPSTASDAIAVSDALRRVTVLRDQDGFVLACSRRAQELEVARVGQTFPADVGDQLTAGLDRSWWQVASVRSDGDVELVTCARTVPQPIELRAIGGLRVYHTRKQQILDEGPALRRAWLCLFFVALAPAPISRRDLAMQLWPGYTVESARSNLKQQLRRLNETVTGELSCEESPLIEEAGQLRINPSMVSFDLMRLRSAVRRAEDLQLSGETDRAQRLALAVFEDMLMGAPSAVGFNETEMNVVPQLRALQPRFGRWVASLGILAATRLRSLDPPATGRGWGLTRYAWAHGRDMPEISMMLIAAFRELGFPVMARWAYEEMYLPNATAPLSWAELTGTSDS